VTVSLLHPLSRFVCAGLVALALAARAAAAEVAEPVIARNADGLLTATAATPGTVVRYTLDGSDPTKSAGVWLAPVQVPSGYTVKARAFSADAASQSGVVTVAEENAGAQPPSTLVPVTQNRDWRNYDWAERHAACVALMRERRPDIVTLGDSITHFWGGEPISARRVGADVWDRLFAGRRVVNLGYGWDRTENVLWRLRHGEFEGVTPRLVVLMIGTNNLQTNSTDEVAAGVEAICAEIHGRSPGTRILLLAIFPRGAKPDETRAKVSAVNAQLAALNGRHGVTYLDIGARFLSADGTIAKEIMYDSLHPTAQGYAIWAEAMEPTMRRLLGEPIR